MTEDIEKRRVAFRRFIEIRGLRYLPWAKRSGVSESTIRNYARQGSSITSLSYGTLQKLAEAEGVTIDDLFNPLERPIERSVNNLRVIRRRRGITQGKLAQSVGVKPPTIQRWESGKRKLRVEDLPKLAQALGVEPADLLNGDTATALPAPELIEGQIKEAFLSIRKVLAQLGSDVTSEQEAELLLTAYRLLVANPHADLEKVILYHLVNNPVRN